MQLWWTKTSVSPAILNSLLKTLTENKLSFRYFLENSSGSKSRPFGQKSMGKTRAGGQTGCANPQGSPGGMLTAEIDWSFINIRKKNVVKTLLIETCSKLVKIFRVFWPWSGICWHLTLHIYVYNFPILSIDVYIFFRNLVGSRV